MRMKLYSYMTLIMLFFVSGVFAQEEGADTVEKKAEVKETSGFTLGAELRTRFEYSPSAGGRNMLVPQEIAPDINTPSGATIWQRSRIIANYKNDRFETNFSFQDVRPFMANKNVTAPYWQSSNGATLGIHEAWGKYYLIKNEDCNLGLKVGRQELANSDGRVIWHRNWNHYSAAFDAVALEGRNKRFNVDWDLVWALNSVDAPTQAETPFRNMVYMEVKKYLGDMLTINALGMVETFEENGNYETSYAKNTLGINPVLNLGALKAEGSFYKQFGKAGETGGGEDINYSGMLYTVSASYKMDIFTFKAGFDSYSGEAWDNDGTDNKINQYQAVCWSGHKYFGNTDFHLRYGKNEGLSDVYLTAKAALSKETTAMLGFHSIMFTNSPGLNAAGNEISALGNNIDFVLTHKPDKTVTVHAGYSVMLPSSDFVEMELGQDTDAKFHGWGWLMLTFKPTFLNM